MKKVAFSASRPAFLGASELERMEEAAIRILAEVGIAMDDPDAVIRLGRAGLRSSGGRVLIEPTVVRAFLDEERKKNGMKTGQDGDLPGPDDNAITLWVSQYSTNFHEAGTDSIVPMTVEKLADSVRILDAFRDRGVVFTACGAPTEVPAEIQPVVTYWNAATHSRQGRNPVDPKNETSVPFVMEMAEALGNPIRRLPVYYISPLTLSGESFRLVSRYKDKLEGITVSGMPSAGTTAPINIGDALAMSAAEAVGCSILIRELIGLPIRWWVGLFPADLRAMSMPFGSPENMLFLMMTLEADAFFHGYRWYPAGDNVHTMAKLPGAQSCAEKASIMTACAMLGARTFSGIGTLSLDEVFSAEQAVYDVEIAEHVRRLVSAQDVDCDVERCLADVREAVAGGGFSGLETTAEAYRDIYWHPPLFERGFLGAWRAEGARPLRQRARDIVQEALRRHDFHLSDREQKAINGILDRARKEFPGASRPKPLP